MDRRSIIKAMLGVVTLPKQVSVGALLGAAQAAPVAGALSAAAANYYDDTAWENPKDAEPWMKRAEEIRVALSHKDRDRRYAADNMPIDIATKKSWSPVFKHHVAAQRHAQERALYFALSKQSSAEQILKLLGLLGDENG